METTRRVTVKRLYPYPSRNGNRMRVEAWCKPHDNDQPNEIVASTFDPFTADTLELAKLKQQDVMLTVDNGDYGYDIIHAERVITHDGGL